MIDWNEGGGRELTHDDKRAMLADIAETFVKRGFLAKEPMPNDGEIALVITAKGIKAARRIRDDIADGENPDFSLARRITPCVTAARFLLDSAAKQERLSYAVADKLLVGEHADGAALEDAITRNSAQRLWDAVNNYRGELAAADDGGADEPTPELIAAMRELAAAAGALEAQSMAAQSIERVMG